MNELERQNYILEMARKHNNETHALQMEIRTLQAENARLQRQVEFLKRQIKEQDLEKK